MWPNEYEYDYEQALLFLEGSLPISYVLYMYICIYIYIHEVNILKCRLLCEWHFDIGIDSSMSIHQINDHL